MSIAHGSHRVPPSTLRTRLREAREFAGLDQADIALKLFVRRTTVSNYERGVSSPNPLQVRAWADACDVSLEWLETGRRPGGDDDGIHSDASPFRRAALAQSVERFTRNDESHAIADIIPLRRVA